jgi:hypothetical protein
MIMSKQSLPERLHEGMHRIPGVPAHSEAARANHRGRLPHQSLQKRSLRKNPPINHSRKEPKVLVGWQNAIARFFARGDK